MESSNSLTSVAWDDCIHRRGTLVAAYFLELLIFEVDGQRHGLPVADVQELLPALSILPLSGTALGVAGVINLRGTILPVVNVRKSLGMPTRPLALSDHFIVIRRGDCRRVLHVDHATELVCLDADALSSVETQGSNGAQKTRVAKVRDGMVVVHEIGDLLAATADEITP
jgi:purine-binding chemotaxis protein CheW